MLSLTLLLLGLFLGLTIQYTSPYEVLLHDPYDGRVGPSSGTPPGTFSRPPASTLDATDFDLNERIAIGSTYALDWTFTRNISWDVYLVSEHWEKIRLHRGRFGRPGYLWTIEEHPFLDSAAMFFFYVVRRDGHWAEGFASRFVNISREVRVDAAALGVASGAGSRGGSRAMSVGVAVLLALVLAVAL